mmetsp:Transcript_72493/g.224990  ORF Transcript_72493/g.224990 Transcript_72493/m.224990 type:complete len:217 (+) Transcript_72493:26-676(+)
MATSLFCFSASLNDGRKDWHARMGHARLFVQGKEGTSGGPSPMLTQAWEFAACLEHHALRPPSGRCKCEAMIRSASQSAAASSVPRPLPPKPVWLLQHLVPRLLLGLGWQVCRLLEARIPPDISLDDALRPRVLLRLVLALLWAVVVLLMRNEPLPGQLHGIADADHEAGLVQQRRLLQLLPNAYELLLDEGPYLMPGAGDDAGDALVAPLDQEVL